MTPERSIEVRAWPMEPVPGELHPEWMVDLKLDGKGYAAITLPVAHPTGPLARDALAAFLRDLADVLIDDDEHEPPTKTEQ